MTANDAIIFEDNHLLAVNKPAGWLVQGDRSGDPTLTDWAKAYLKEKYAKPGAVYLHPVHRIDRPVSGAVLFARTEKALGRLNALFRGRKLVKQYLALTVSAPEVRAGELRHFLLKDERRNIVQVFAQPRAEAKEAVLQYEYLDVAGIFHLLRVQPHTGRPHQIRAQLSVIGCPIVGDLKYGAPEALPDASIGLHARSLAFEHPVRREPVIIEAPCPKLRIWEAVERIIGAWQSQ